MAIIKRHYKSPTQISRARDLRHDSTEVEKKLWRHLRAHRFIGYKFRRQHPVGKYYLDFACVEHKVAVELDGSQHGEEANLVHDAFRAKLLERSGWRVLRFWNNEVNQNLEGLLEAILAALADNRG